jgi:hypothetical protein
MSMTTKKCASSRGALFFMALLVVIQGTVAMNDFASFLSTRFEKQFHRKCDKYPFVQHHYAKLENPGERYINFVYQEPGLRNGGLGDRIGGLVSAAAIAMRFNRTLVIRSYNGLGELMRPYHPHDSGDNPKYNYKNLSSWSAYDGRYENNDNTEYDLWMCINNTGQKNAQCSMLSGDVGQPYILYRSNRAYFCFYSNHADLQLVLGINQTSDMFEAAGCLLRLVYWPTNKLWDAVGKIYGDYARTLLKKDGVSTGARRRHRNLVEGVANNDNKKQQHGTSASSLSSTPRLRSADLVQSGKASSLLQTSLGAAVQDHIIRPPQTERRMDETIPDADIWHANRAIHDSFYQVGIHYRCGDQSYLQHGGFDNWCVWDPTNTNPKYLENMKIGNPSALAQCAKEVMFNHTQAEGSSSDNREQSHSSTATDADGNTGIVDSALR